MQDEEEEQEERGEQKEATNGKVTPPVEGMPKLSEDTSQAVQLLLFHGAGKMITIKNCVVLLHNS